MRTEAINNGLPSPKDLTRYLGVELEVDKGGEDNEEAENVLDKVDDNYNNKRLYIKHDGSLDEGFELVTHPMTLEFHKTEMNWEEILEYLVDRGYRSHDSGTCGLHCHVNRNSLGYTISEQEATTAKILYFVERHWKNILRFSRRTQEQMERWANRYGIKSTPSDVLDEAKGSYSRYRCVNLQNEDTIEFRMFRGTLKYNTFIATLEFVNEICNVAYKCSDSEMQDLTWNEFISNLDTEKCSELITYLKERNLYINEPVDADDEI
jgi:hypothetical protein